MNSYHSALSDRGIDLVIIAAQQGWSPADLLHVLGKYCYPIVYRAAGRVPAQITSTVLRKEWLTLEPPTSMSMTTTELEQFITEIMRLPRLRDVDALIDESSAQQPRRTKEAKVRTRITNLLKKAESTPYEEEASALIAKAQSLQQRHRMEEIDSNDAAEFVSRRVRISAPYINHKSTLLSVIADRNGCSALQIHPKGIITIFGTEGDLRHVLDLFRSLQRQCDWHMRHGEHAENAQKLGNLASYRRSFILSYASRIGELLDEANKTFSPHEPRETDLKDSAHQDDPHALTLTNRAFNALDQRRLDAEAARDRHFPNARTISLAMGSRAGMSAGAAAAEKSHLNGDSFGVDGHRQLTR